MSIDGKLLSSRPEAIYMHERCMRVETCNNSAPVSYTHLDVYKRQDENGSVQKPAEDRIKDVWLKKIDTQICSVHQHVRNFILCT